ncbi:unnamed protein product [Moneuplotes crassus]|uniref:Uncharacterized protein n=1 Tax=Euplotes crassus TaxID=5936 RepID=A0AAD1Y741_EUPCR|nr:unnamed protein product [Moneuplotes crassus]
MDFKLSSSEIDKTFKPGNLWREMFNYTNSHDKSSLISKYISEEMIKKEIRCLIQDMKVKKTIFKSFNLFKAYFFEKILAPLHSKSQDPRSFESRKLKLLMKILSTQEFYIQEKKTSPKQFREKEFKQRRPKYNMCSNRIRKHLPRQKRHEESIENFKQI